MKRKIISLIAVLALLMSMAACGQTAEVDAATGEAGEEAAVAELTFHSADALSQAEYYAYSMNSVGLFQGVGTNSDGSINFDLERPATRVEALVMLIRLLGQEEAAKAYTGECPFSDVPNWAKNYVGYAYENGLTTGVSAKEFGTGNATAQQYITFVLRALGYSDSDTGSTLYKEALSFAETVPGLLNNEEDPYPLDLGSDFWRADAVDISYRALIENAMKDGSQLYTNLVESGAVTIETDETAGEGSAAENETEELIESEGIGMHKAEIKIKNYGTIKLELDGDTAPITVQNFMDLAKSGFYDGLTFHRIIDGFMIQGGDPLGNGTGGSDKNIIGEFNANGHKNDISHTKGTISMARSSAPNSASSQFFIMVADGTYLDGNYAAFGHVTEGQDIVDKIAKEIAPKATDGNGSISKADQPVIESITIVD